MRQSVSRATALLLLLSTQIFGQGTTSRVTGTVTDGTGSTVAGAVVTLTNDGTGAAFTVTTPNAGTYAFEAVQVGQYSVTVEAKGFRKFVSRSNPVNIGQPATVNASLEVGGTTEVVEVVASAETVQTSSSGNFGNLIAEKVIKDLPIVGTRGRNPLDLVLLQPGVVSGGNTGGGTHVSGARDRAWNFTLDGIDTNETSAGGSNFSPIRTNPDSVAEFRVITGNATADSGRSSGAQVMLVTKSGSNEFHGKGFYFYRTPRLNANEWENNVNLRGKRQFVQHIWGGDMGGPIVKNKLFFYSNLQQLRAQDTSLANRTVFTQTARQGVLRYVQGGRNFPAGTATASVDASGNPVGGLNIGTYNVANNDPQRLGLDRRISGLVANTPLPNNFFGGDGLNTAFYTFTAIQVESQYDWTGKVDFIANEKNTLFARVSLGAQNTLCDNGNGGSELFPGRGCVVNTERTPRNMAYNWRWNPTPSVTNEVVVGLNQFKFDFAAPFAKIDEYAINAPVALIEGSSFGNTRRLRTWQIVDNLAWQRGAHSFKFGTNLRFASHLDFRGSIGGVNSAPTLDFSTGINVVDPRTFGLPTGLNVQFDQGNFQSWINTMLGRVGRRTQAFVGEGSAYRTGLFEYDARYNEFDFYAQDTWKARRNLTIDIGVRWEIKMSPTAVQGILSPNQAVAAGAAASNTLKWVEQPMFRSAWRDFAPSLGFAWDPFGSGKTSVRGNYRLAFDRLPTFLASSFVFPALPGKIQAVTDDEFGRTGGRLAQVQAIPVPAGNPNDRLQPAAFSLNSNSVFDPNFQYPYTHQWGFSIQREISKKTVFEVTYSGRRAYNLFGGYNANQPELYRNGFVQEFIAVKNGGESALINRLASADARRRANESPSAMYRRLFPADFANNNMAVLANRITQQQQGGRSVIELSGQSPTSLIPFPQYSGGLNVIDSNDFSTYHGLTFQLERRMSNGFSGQISYTLSKALDSRSFDPVFTLVSTGAVQSAGGTPFDINNRKLNYALSDFDRTHVVQSNFLWELPFGKGKKFGTDSGFVDRIIGGWQVAGIVRVLGGRPMTAFSGFNTFNLGNNSTANCNGCSRQLGAVRDEAGLVWYFSPEERAKFSQPGPGELGNTGRNYFRGPGAFNMDASFVKRTKLWEKWDFEIRADATNLTNTPTFGFPTTTLSSTLFGRIRDTVISGSRKVQLGAKINF